VTTSAGLGASAWGGRGLTATTLPDGVATRAAAVAGAVADVTTEPVSGLGDRGAAFEAADVDAAAEPEVTTEPVGGLGDTGPCGDTGAAFEVGGARAEPVTGLGEVTGSAVAEPEVTCGDVADEAAAIDAVGSAGTRAGVAAATGAAVCTVAAAGGGTGSVRGGGPVLAAGGAGDVGFGDVGPGDLGGDEDFEWFVLCFDSSSSSSSSSTGALYADPTDQSNTSI
jgi:hypothetical protein